MAVKKKGGGETTGNDLEPGGREATQLVAAPTPPKPPAKKPSSKDMPADKSDKPDKKDKKDQESKGGPVQQLQQLIQFLNEVLIEFRKVTWPDRRTVFRETMSVLALVATITLMVLAFDWVIGQFVFGPIEHFARLHGGGVGHRM